MLLPSNGSSIQSPRPLTTTTGSLTHLICKETTLDADLLLQDGGNSGDTKKMPLLPMRREESWISKEDLTLKTETSLLIHFTGKSTSNGRLFSLMNGRENQLKESLMKISVFMLREISTLYLL